MSYKVFTNGSVLNASELNEFLMNQSVIAFSNSTARASAITSPVEGMLTYLEDTNTYQFWNGSAWTNLVATSGAGTGNAIINGGFDIWQRGTTFTGVGGYTADRWNTYSPATPRFTPTRSTDVPTSSGLTYSWVATSTGAYTPASGEYIMNTTRIEGFNAAQFNLGTASATSMTLSFWVKSSLTGTFGGAFHNTAFDRTFVFSYTISAANTWERKTILVAGDTTGTYNKTTDVGLELGFSLGAHTASLTTAGSWVSGAFWGVTGQVNVIGTTGATWQVTGVQLEAGTSATAFRRNANSLAGELAACQRYFLGVPAGSSALATGVTLSSTGLDFFMPLPVSMRTTPSSLTFTDLRAGDGISGAVAFTSVTIAGGSTHSVALSGAVPSTSTNKFYTLRTLSSTGFLGLSAEL